MMFSLARGRMSSTCRLLMYHGWNDQLIAPQNSIDHFTSVQKAMGAAKAAEFVRLFMAPGMTHCAGGPGPNTFDMLTLLEQWVEKGNAPTQVTASHSTNGTVDRTRPLCAYPQIARYKGAGSIDEAASFICQAP
jgi:tannase/feruloyl esterase